ncbi:MULTISPECIES: hypothetical protein [unclassified Pseudoalteromonas]|uniref:hypothetical protein n=1 Tax=unclassified Pseudoalteromonas TaxID=194690 RepID=UPI00040247E8|nr:MULTISPECIES: hypothetical protein [unclassified Pseudoalteromonas]
MEELFWQLNSINEYFGIFITWLFVFAFLYTLSVAINRQDKSRVHLSFIMMISYTFSLFMDISTTAPHLKLFMFDVLTIVVIVIWRICLGSKIPYAFSYLVVGLSINATLFISMYFDNTIYDNWDFWWLWMLYGFLMPIIDIVMALVLIINKDLLKLVWLIKKLKPSFVTKTN